MLLNRERNVRHEAWKNFCQAGMRLILEESCQHSRMKLTVTSEVSDRSFMKFLDVSVDHPKHPSHMAIVTEECRVLLMQRVCSLLSPGMHPTTYRMLQSMTLQSARIGQATGSQIFI